MTRLRQHLHAFVTWALYRIGQRLLAWARPHYSDENSFLPDCLQIDIEHRRLREEFDAHINLFNVCADDYNRKLGLYHAEIFQEGVNKDAVHVCVSDDGREFHVQRQVLSPAQMRRGIELSMEGLNLAICRHFLGDVEELLEERAVENTIKKIVAEEI
ncbi:MAG: hypothetical protein F4096_11565 [Rhodothermaceae bacterium]|nr:hypothetical protein [Rhodothermaceae bacterium]